MTTSPSIPALDIADAIERLDHRLVLTGYHQQYCDDSLKPLRGFVRSNFNPLVYHSAVRAYEKAQLEPLSAERKGILLGSLFTDAITEEESMKDLVQGKRLSPIMFPQSVPNAIVSVIAKQLEIHGPMSCVSVSRNSIFQLLDQASIWLDDDDVDVVLITFCDVSTLRTRRWVSEHAASESADTDDKQVFTDSAISFVLETKTHAFSRNAKVHSSVKDLYINCNELPVLYAHNNWNPVANPLPRLLKHLSKLPVVIGGGKVLSGTQLMEQVSVKRERLIKNNVSDCRVAIALPDSFSLLEWVLACWSLDNCVLLMDPRLTESEIKQQLDAFNPNVKIAIKENNAVAAPLNTFVSEIETTVSHFKTAGAHRLSGPELAQFSSGSSGTPKLVIRSWASLCEEWQQYQFEPGSPDRLSQVLCLVPMSHSYGLLTATLHTILRGGCVIFPERIHPGSIVDTLLQEKISHLYAVPFHYQLIFHELKNRRHALQHTPILLSSGGRLKPELHYRYQHDLQLAIGEQYGMSEMGYIAVDFYGKTPGSCGRIAAHHRYQLSKEGELHFFMSNTPYTHTQENWRSTNKNEDCGILNTQDIVNFDSMGNIQIVGRSNDQVSIGGLKVVLAEIENTVIEHEAIQACCIVAHEHPVLDIWLQAFIVTEMRQSNLTNELQEWLKQRLSAYKIPKKFTVVNQIPVSPAGKINKAKLIQVDA